MVLKVRELITPLLLSDPTFKRTAQYTSIIPQNHKKNHPLNLYFAAPSRKLHKLVLSFIEYFNSSQQAKKMYEYLFYLNIYLLNKKGDNRRPPSDYETVRLHHLQIDICKLIQNKN